MFKTSFCLVLLIIITQLSGCSSVQPTVSNDSMREKDLAIIPSPTPENSPRSFQSDYFEEEWKSKYEKTISELNKNRQVWQEKKIANYNFVCEQFQGGTYGFRPVLVQVRDNKPFSLGLPENVDLTMERIDDYDKMDSFENMFNFIQQELDKGRVLTVKYNKLGFPQKIDILYFYGPHGTKVVRISKFEIIK